MAQGLLVGNGVVPGVGQRQAVCSHQARGVGVDGA